MRQHVFFRDKGRCAACGTIHPYLDGDWEADHVLPLMISWGDPSFFEPENVVILCTKPCHTEKSARDLREYRRKFRRKVAYILGEIDDQS